MRINQGIFNLLCYYERTLGSFENYIAALDPTPPAKGLWEHRFGTVVGAAALEVTPAQREEIWKYRNLDAPAESVPDFPRMPQAETGVGVPNAPSANTEQPGASSFLPIKVKAHLHARVQMNGSAWNSRQLYSIWQQYETACLSGDAGGAASHENALRAALQAANTIRGDADDLG